MYFEKLCLEILFLNLKLTVLLISILHAEKIAKAVLLYVFKIKFPASLFSQATSPKSKQKVFHLNF